MANVSDAPRRISLLNRFLNTIETVGNKLPDPLVLYIVLAALVPVLSLAVAAAGLSAVHPVTGETVQAVNLLNGQGIRRMMSEAVENFASFPPLATVLVAMMGIGVAERTGLIALFLRMLVKAAPPSLLSGVVVLAGVMSSMAVDAGYVVLTPLGAVVFASVGRHPVAGLAAAFAGTGGGFSANLLLTALDPLLAGFTTPAAQLFDPEVVVRPDANYYFMIASTFLVTGLGWWVTEKIVEPRLGKWNPANAAVSLDDHMAGAAGLTPKEKKAAGAALLSLVIFGVVLLWLTVPAAGLLRDEEGTLAPFINSLVVVIALTFLIPGTIYGLVLGNLRDTGTFAKMTGDTMATMGGYIVLAFAAAQFVAWFKWSNLGLLTALGGASFLKNLGLGEMPLVLLIAFVAVAAVINLVIGSASAKWGIMAPVFVPLFMALGVSPEMTQATYRVGDSITNMVTPLNPYFPIILSFALRYDRRMGIGSLISATVPYALAFAAGWTALLIIWYMLGLPLGPGAGMLYGG